MANSRFNIPTSATAESRTMQLLAPGLGYGCSQLMGGITRDESITLLDTAFDAGIRHFDTAPSYGYGQAESVLGAAFHSRRSQVTITTKFGLRPPRSQNLLGVARRLVLPVVRNIPSVKSRLSRAAGGLVGRARFSPDELRSSIDASLTALRTDYVDILLLHEATALDLSDDLFGELERSVEAGKIRSFGVGSEAAKAAEIYRLDRRFCPVLQFEWSVLSGSKPAYPGSFVITHRSLSADFSRLRAWLAGNAQAAWTWSRELGLDVANPSILSRLMLAAARVANPEGMTLFSSRRAGNIRANAQLMLDPGVTAAKAFVALLARNAPATLMRKSPGSELQGPPGE